MEFTEAYEFEHPAERVWAIIAAGEYFDWVSAGEVFTEKSGEGVGMTIALHWGGLLPTTFRVQSLDPRAMKVVYAVEANEDLPLENLRISFQIERLTDKRCRETISYRCELPAGLHADEVSTTIRMMTELAADNLRKRLDRDAGTEH